MGVDSQEQPNLPEIDTVSAPFLRGGLAQEVLFAFGYEPGLSQKSNSWLHLWTVDHPDSNMFPPVPTSHSIQRVFVESTSWALTNTRQTMRWYPGGEAKRSNSSPSGEPVVIGFNSNVLDIPWERDNWPGFPDGETSAILIPIDKLEPEHIEWVVPVTDAAYSLLARYNIGSDTLRLTQPLFCNNGTARAWSNVNTGLDYRITSISSRSFWDWVGPCDTDYEPFIPPWKEVF